MSERKESRDQCQRMVIAAREYSRDVGNDPVSYQYDVLFPGPRSHHHDSVGGFPVVKSFQDSPKSKRTKQITVRISKS